MRYRDDMPANVTNVSKHEPTRLADAPTSMRRRLMMAAAVATLAAAALLCAVFFRSLTRLQETAHARLDAQANDSLFQIEHRYQTAVTMLKSMRGLFYEDAEVTADGFERFVVTSGFHDIFTEFGVIAYVIRVQHAEQATFEARARLPIEEGGTGFEDFAIWPSTEHAEHWTVLYTIPMPQQDGPKLGWDIREEPIRLAAAEKARDIGDVVISDDVTLLVDGRQGAIIVVPMYATKDTPKTLEERREAFSGVLAVSFAYEDFPLGALSTASLNERSVSVSMGRQGSRVPFFRPDADTPNYARFYGDVSTTRHLQLNAHDTIDVTFSAPTVGLLSHSELVEPIGITVTFISIASAAALFLLFLRRTQVLSELRLRYEFVKTISHQLRTPITKMRWATEALAESDRLKDDPSLAVVTGEILILNSIINDLLLYLEWGHMRHLGSDLRNASARGIIEGAIAKLDGTADKTRISLDLAAAYDAVVRCDLEKLSTAVKFLIENALAYSTPQSAVKIVARQDDGSLEINIIDHGIGIPASEQRKVFDIFYRATNASLGKNAGSGVGIPLAKTIVEAHGGAISFTSTEGQGTAFQIRLPLARHGDAQER